MGSILSLYSSNEQLEIELFKSSIYKPTLTMKIFIRILKNREIFIQDFYAKNYKMTLKEITSLHK